MKPFSFVRLAVLIVVCTGCAPMATQSTFAGAVGKSVPQTGKPIFNGDSDYIMIPIVPTHSGGGPELSLSSLSKKMSGSRHHVGGDVQRRLHDVAGGLEAYVGSDHLHVFNIIIYHRTEGTSRLLLDKPGHIRAFYYAERPDAKSTNPAHAAKPSPLIFAARTEDTNRDRRINNFDALQLFVCDPSGANVRAVTPKNSKYQGFRVDPVSGDLFVEAKIDADSDGKFEDTEPNQIFRVSIQRPRDSSPVVPDQLLQQAIDMANRASK